jgi:hypothetical protein
MASRTMMDRARVFGPQIKDIQFRFFPQGTSTTAFTVANGNLVTDGGVASVQRTSNAGEFTVTLDDNYYKVLSAQAQVQLATKADLKAQIGTISNEGTATALSFIINLLAVATGTDMAADANNSVFVQLRLKDSDG